MKVRVRYFAALREITGKREEQVELQPDSTMRDLFNSLVELHGTRFKEYVLEEKTGSPRTHLIFLINGTSINSLQGLETRLNDDSVISMMPPVGGG